MDTWNNGARRLMARSFMAIGLTLLAFSQAYAGPPSAANSICPPAVFVTPNATCCFDVIVRDAANNPVAGSSVVVDLGACPVTFCPAQPPGITVIGNSVNTTADASGRAHFCICGTFTGPCTTRIIADGILLCSNIPVASDCSPTPNRKSAWGQLKIHYR
jgi:hypothetical protein